LALFFLPIILTAMAGPELSRELRLLTELSQDLHQLRLTNKRLQKSTRQRLTDCDVSEVAVLEAGMHLAKANDLLREKLSLDYENKRLNMVFAAILFWLIIETKIADSKRKE
jgi:hypothetical protein